MSRPDFSPLTNILDREERAGRAVAFWWRDDDAVAASPALGRLLALAESVEAAVAVAVVPALAEASLAEMLAEHPATRVLVHGLAHLDHAPPAEKKAEFGAHRPIATLESEAAQALAAIRTRFGAPALPVLVPPWNRIDPALIPRLAPLGYAGLSAFGSHRREASGGLRIVNTHLDPVDWRGARGSVQPVALADALERALAEGPGEPIGLLTHHLAFDEELWSFCAALVEAVGRHPAMRFVEPDALWPSRRH